MPVGGQGIVDRERRRGAAAGVEPRQECLGVSAGSRNSDRNAGNRRRRWRGGNREITSSASDSAFLTGIYLIADQSKHARNQGLQSCGAFAWSEIVGGREALVSIGNIKKPSDIGAPYVVPDKRDRQSSACIRRAAHHLNV